MSIFNLCATGHMLPFRGPDPTNGPLPPIPVYSYAPNFCLSYIHRWIESSDRLLDRSSLETFDLIMDERKNFMQMWLQEQFHQ